MNIVKSGYPFVGTHIVINLYDILNLDLLNYLPQCKPNLDNLIKQLNLTVVNQAGYQFEPKGYTFIYVLSESHLSIHTYPEYNSCYIDIFCCNPDFNSLDAIKIIKQFFNTDNVSYNVIIR